MKVNGVALVTGGNRGIGFEIVRQLAEAGVFVLLGARDQRRGRDAAEKLMSMGLTVHAIVFDVLDEQQIARAVDIIESDYGRLDILVNSAGIADVEGDGTPSKAEMAMVRLIVDTNFFGTLAVTQAVLPLLRRAPFAAIVNVSSRLGSISVCSNPSFLGGRMSYIGYSASKAALNMLTVQLAAELNGTSIVANSISPSRVRTDQAGKGGDLFPEDAAKTAVQYALLGKGSVSGRFVEAGIDIPW